MDHRRHNTNIKTKRPWQPKMKTEQLDVKGNTNHTHPANSKNHPATSNPIPKKRLSAYPRLEAQSVYTTMGLGGVNSRLTSLYVIHQIILIQK